MDHDHEHDAEQDWGHGRPPSRSPFDRLVRLLAEGAAAPGPELARLGGPAVLDRLLRAALVAALRRGPASVDEGWGPARLLAAAVGGSEAGAVPVATVARLRGTLERLSGELHRGRCWDPAMALWWEPLPERSALEECWRSFEGEPSAPYALTDGTDGGGPMTLHLPPAAELADALLSTSGAGWRAVPGALGEGLVARLHGELVAAEGAGILSLARGGVGQSDRSSSERTDRVVYLTGFEAEVLREAPGVAVFVQWLLSRSVDRLLGEADRAGGSQDELRLHAPGSVMIARYRAPSRGFVPHLDNPGGEADNARAITLVTYLNAPDQPCNGGELALWNPAVPGGRKGGMVTVGERPEVLPAIGGTVVAFDARRVVHEVRTLDEGPDRWTAVVWLSDAPSPRLRGAEPPEPTIGQVLEGVERVPLPAGRVLLRSVACPPEGPGEGPGGGRGAAIEVESVAVTAGDGVAPSAKAGVGLVCTTHRVGESLERFVRHHLDLGVEHLLLVIDDAAGPEVAEEARGLIASLGQGPVRRVEVWSPEEAAERRRALGGVQPDFDELMAVAEEGAATHAVAARQTLNATAALVAARAGDPRGRALGWLLHLDADELFWPEGIDRGGRDLAEHFAAADAAGLTLLCYVNHELLLPVCPGEAPRFKLNPRLAAIRLGPVGWSRMVEQLAMEQDGARPYFRAYWNGKSAVRVAAGRAAAGVHGWSLHGAGADEQAPRLMAGPSILHLHLPTVDSFVDKYRTVAGAAVGEDRPFPPSPLEVRAAGLVRELAARGAGEEELRRSLDSLYREALCFVPEEVELLEEAGLVFGVPGL